MQYRLSAAAVALTLVLAGCGGRAASSLLPVTGGALGAPAAKSTRAGKARVAFNIAWKTHHPFRRPHYLPATARSISVSVNGGMLVYGNSPQPTLQIQAPIGVDTFAIQSYDEQNGQGNVLSRAMVTQTVTLGQGNVISATLNGVVASLAIALTNPTPNAGAPATTAIDVQALDADGNVIVGAGDYSTPVKLSIVDPANSKTLSLTNNLLQNPSGSSHLVYTGGTLSGAFVVASATGTPLAFAAFNPAPTFYQYATPVSSNRTQWIAAGPDGNMWFTESPNAIGRITPAGVVTEFTTPTLNSNPQGIIAASDGRMWFTEFNSSKIGQITMSGTITEVATLFGNDGPQLLVDRGDGTVWHTGSLGAHIGYESFHSISGEITVPTPASQPYGITTAPDNNLYFTEAAADKIGRLPFAEQPLTPGTTPLQIVRGPDGNLWFTEYGTHKIGRFSSTSFSVTGEFPTLTANSHPWGITVGADGALWFTESALDKIGRITTDGVVTEYSSPVTGLNLLGIASGPDGSLWFAESNSPGHVGRLVY